MHCANTVRGLAVMSGLGILSASHDGWSLRAEHRASCSDGFVRIWTVNQHRASCSAYFSQLAQHKISRKMVGGLKLEELPGLEALQIPDNPYDAADKWLLKENLPLSYRERVVAFILQNTGQKDFTLDPSFRDPYTRSSAYVPGQTSNKSPSAKPTFKHIPKNGMLAFDLAQFDGILKKITEFNNNILSEHVGSFVIGW